MEHSTISLRNKWSLREASRGGADLVSSLHLTLAGHWIKHTSELKGWRRRAGELPNEDRIEEKKYQSRTVRLGVLVSRKSVAESAEASHSSQIKRYARVNCAAQSVRPVRRVLTADLPLSPPDTRAFCNFAASNIIPRDMFYLKAVGNV